MFTTVRTIRAINSDKLLQVLKAFVDEWPACDDDELLQSQGAVVLIVYDLAVQMGFDDDDLKVIFGADLLNSILAL